MANKYLKFLLTVFQRWSRNDGMGLSAAVSFYSMFAMAPLFLLSVKLAGKFLGDKDARESIEKVLSQSLPNSDIDTVLDFINPEAAGAGMSAISIVILVWASSVVFVRLQTCVRKIFEEEISGVKHAIKRSLKGRIYSLGFAMISGIIFAIMAAGMSVMIGLGNILHINISIMYGLGSGFILSLIGVWVIHISTAESISLKNLFYSGVFLFVSLIMGKFFVAAYVSRSTISDAYGVASSLVVVLVWIFYLVNFFCFSVALCAELQSSRGKEK